MVKFYEKSPSKNIKSTIQPNVCISWGVSKALLGSWILSQLYRASHKKLPPSTLREKYSCFYKKWQIAINHVTKLFLYLKQYNPEKVPCELILFVLTTVLFIQKT